jgi:tetratricopeptide (TPR) repeat protein
MAAMPARYALERGDWAAASRLQVQPTKYPYTDAVTWFARGMGAARLGGAAEARNAARRLAAIQQRLIDANEDYWALQVEIQRTDVLAWAALANKDSNAALAEMHKAVELESTTEKSVVTPGPIAPATELSGELFLELNRPSDALRQFEATLKKEPNRFRSLYGAADAAKLVGNAQSARRYAAALLKVCAHADHPGRAELAVARAIANSEGAQR